MNLLEISILLCAKKQYSSNNRALIKMKKLSFIIVLFFISSVAIAQETEEVLRLNIVNPGIEYELPMSGNSTISVNVGVGYSGSYPELTTTTFGTGGIYVIAPFADVQYKYYYNLNKRFDLNKSTTNNSGNFFSLRFRTRGQSIDENIIRKADYDFAIGPTWGIQRQYDKFHLLFDLGPQFYFDSEGNHGFWPLMPQINFGFNL